MRYVAMFSLLVVSLLLGASSLSAATAVASVAASPARVAPSIDTEIEQMSAMIEKECQEIELESLRQMVAPDFELAAIDEDCYDDYASIDSIDR